MSDAYPPATDQRSGSGGALSDSGPGAGDVDPPTSPPGTEGEVTHTSPDQVPHYRRARWIKAHAHELGA